MCIHVSFGSRSGNTIKEKNNLKNLGEAQDTDIPGTTNSGIGLWAKNRGIN